MIWIIFGQVLLWQLINVLQNSRIERNVFILSQVFYCFFVYLIPEISFDLSWNSFENVVIGQMLLTNFPKTIINVWHGHKQAFNLLFASTQPAIRCSKLIADKLEQGVK